MFEDGQCDDCEATGVYVAQRDEGSLLRRLEEIFGTEAKHIFNLDCVQFDNKAAPNRTPETVLAGRFSEQAGGKELTEGDYYALLASATLGNRSDIIAAVWIHAARHPAALAALERYGSPIARLLRIGETMGGGGAG